MFIFIRKNGYYASQKRLCKQLVLRGGIFIAFSKRQFEVKKFLKIQLYQYVREWLDTGKKFSGLIKKSACLLLPLNIVNGDGETPKKKKSRGKKILSNIAETRVVVVDIFGNKMTMEEAKKLLNTVVEKDGKFYKCVRIEDLPQNMKLKPK